MYVVSYVYKNDIGYHNIQCIENLSSDKNQDGELSASELTSPAEKAFKVLDQDLSLKIMEFNAKHFRRIEFNNSNSPSCPRG